MPPLGGVEVVRKNMDDDALNSVFIFFKSNDKLPPSQDGLLTNLVEDPLEQGTNSSPYS